MLRQHALPIDYQHIRVYAQIKEYTAGWVKGQQWLAHRMNAPHDTVYIFDGAPVRFGSLPTETRKHFMGGLK